MKALQQTDDGLAFEDGVLTLADGRELAWRWWGDEGGVPVLRIQGTPSCRLQRNPDPSVQKKLGVRYLMADRPGYGGSTRKPGRGIADVAGDSVALLDHFGIDRIPAMGISRRGAAAAPERRGDEGRAERRAPERPQDHGGPHVAAPLAREPRRDAEARRGRLHESLAMHRRWDFSTPGRSKRTSPGGTATTTRTHLCRRPGASSARCGTSTYGRGTRKAISCP